MRKKGFTLVELLAVIVILSVIALIAIPLILNIVSDAKKSALKDSTYTLVKAAENYLSMEQIHGKEIDWKTNKITNEKYISFNLSNEEDVKKLSVKGKIPKKGRVEITNKGDTFVVAIDEKICAKKNYKENIVKLLSLNSDDICLLTASSDDLNSEESNDIISTITKLSSRVDELEKDNKDLKEKINNNEVGTENALNKIYPVGSIYVSTSLKTAEEVKNALGGEWESYGDGKVLRGTTKEANKEGGTEGNISLADVNLPPHSHLYTPSGTVTSTFTGNKVTTGNNSVTPTATFSGSSATTSSNGSHTHTFEQKILAWPSGTKTGYEWQAQYIKGDSAYPYARWIDGTLSGGAHTHTVTAKGTVSLSNTTHTHSVTAAGTVTSTFAGTKSDTEVTGSSTPFSVLDPYITVYMYKRTK
ncbi:MAG: type II secretion system protein [Bacilli bacterium]|nr:type II secretion system protein [Bacilli bacterium]